MSAAYKCVTLTCDRCGAVFDDGVSMSFDEARSVAQRAGWRSEAELNLDDCPRHFPPDGRGVESCPHYGGSPSSCPICSGVDA